MIRKSSFFALSGLCTSVFLLMQSCSSTEVAESKDVNPKQIYQHYTVTYDAAKNNINARATFRFGGSKGTTPASIRVNDMEMKGKEGFLSGYFYFNNRFIPETGTFVFVYRDFENKIFTNGISIFPVSAIHCSDSIQAGSEEIISWEGLPVQPNERVICRIRDANGSKVSIHTVTEGSREIRIPAGRLQNLAEGTLNIQLTREISNPLIENNPGGGIIESNYYSQIKISFLNLAESVENSDI